MSNRHSSTSNVARLLLPRFPVDPLFLGINLNFRNQNTTKPTEPKQNQTKPKQKKKKEWYMCFNHPFFHRRTERGPVIINNDNTLAGWIRCFPPREIFTFGYSLRGRDLHLQHNESGWMVIKKNCQISVSAMASVDRARELIRLDDSLRLQRVFLAFSRLCLFTVCVCWPYLE